MLRDKRYLSDATWFLGAGSIGLALSLDEEQFVRHATHFMVRFSLRRVFPRFPVQP